MTGSSSHVLVEKIVFSYSLSIQKDSRGNFHLCPRLLLFLGLMENCNGFSPHYILNSKYAKHYLFFTSPVQLSTLTDDTEGELVLVFFA